MAIQLNEARNPQWSNAGNTAILLECQFEHLPGEFVQFCAMPSDVEAHGREIFQRASDGEFGAIAPYVPPTPSISQVNAGIKKQIATLETKQARAVREFILSGDKTRIEAIEAEIVALRGSLQ